MTVDVSTWSETPASNTTVDGNNIAEACSPGTINNAIRSVMAGIKTFNLAFVALTATVAAKVSAAAGVFSGTQPIYTGEGAFWHHASSSNASGKVSVLPEGSSRPASPANGDIVFYYTP